MNAPETPARTGEEETEIARSTDRAISVITTVHFSVTIVCELLPLIRLGPRTKSKNKKRYELA